MGSKSKNQSKKANKIVPLVLKEQLYFRINMLSTSGTVIFASKLVRSSSDHDYFSFWAAKGKRKEKIFG